VVISDFSLTDSIESGLVKVPQLVARDGSGALMPAISTSGHGYCRS
jgi:hypothetical protein